MSGKGKGAPLKKKAKSSSKNSDKIGIASFFSPLSRGTQQNSTKSNKKDPPITIIDHETSSKLAAVAYSYTANAPDKATKKQIAMEADLAAFFEANHPPSSFKCPKTMQHGANRSCKKEILRRTHA